MAHFHSLIRDAATQLGGQAKLAKAIGRAQSEVHRLCNSARSVSPEVAIAISKATGGKVSINQLIPEVVQAVADELARTSEAA